MGVLEREGRKDLYRGDINIGTKTSTGYVAGGVAGSNDDDDR